MLEEGIKAPEFSLPDKDGNIVNLSDFNVGEVVVAKPKVGLVIKSCDGLINIIELQPENGKAMLSKSYLNGKQIEVKSKVLSE